MYVEPVRFMPPAAVKTIRDLIHWQYAKIISESAGAVVTVAAGAATEGGTGFDGSVGLVIRGGNDRGWGIFPSTSIGSFTSVAASASARSSRLVFLIVMILW